MIRPVQATIIRVAAIGAGLVAVGGLLVPRGARPLVSVLVAIVLVGVIAAAVDLLRARSAQPTTSAFDRPPTRRRDDLPSDLHGLTVDARRIKSRRPVPSVVFWRMRRIGGNRLRARHGLDIGDATDHPCIAAVVSPDLFLLLTDDHAQVAGEAVPRLITELEHL